MSECNRISVCILHQSTVCFVGKLAKACIPLWSRRTLALCQWEVAHSCVASDRPCCCIISLGSLQSIIAKLRVQHCQLEWMAAMTSSKEACNEFTYLDSTIKSAKPQTLALPWVANFCCPLAPGPLPNTTIHVVVLLWFGICCVLYDFSLCSFCGRGRV